MTWSLTHTVAWDGNNATNHTALSYMFDTYLPSKGFTVTAHPDASAYKRSFSKTYTNTAAPGSETQYWWVNWLSTTNSTDYTIYMDATYTTVPGDLGTYTSFNSGSNNFNTSSYPSIYNFDWKFWTSDQVSNSSLVTRGKKVMWYDPGNTAMGVVKNQDWLAGGDVRRNTIIAPFATNGGGQRHWGAPFSTTTQYYLITLAGFNSTYIGQMNDTFYQNFPVYLSASSTGPTTSMVYSHHINQSDVLLHQPVSISPNTFMGGNVTDNGVLLEVNGRWYIRTKPNMTLPSYVFDMGTSEPDLT